MNTIVVLNDQVSPLNVLASKLRVKRYTEIRLKGEKYGDVLSRSLSCFKKKQAVLIYSKPEGQPRFKDLVQFIKNSGVTITPQTRVLFLNLSHYITDLRTVDTILQKMMTIDEPVYGVLRQMPMGWFCVPFSWISAQANSPSIVGPSATDHCISLDRFVINLQDPKVVLDLFASSFDTRHFNQIKQDDVYFIKTSKDQEKLKKEHRFLANIPNPLRPFYPHVGDFFTNSEYAQYQVERVFAFNLSTLLVHNTLNPDVFSRLLTSLSSYLDRCDKKNVSEDQIEAMYRDVFINKLKTRFEQFKTQSCFAMINTYWQTYSGKSCDAYIASVIAELERAIPEFKEQSLVFSHGDLCFSNILFDVDTASIKLIDPKGKAEDDDACLPVHYDLAKLSHSILGGYDYIMAGHSEIKLTKELQLVQEFHGISHYDEYLKNQFSKWVSSRCSLKEIRLCEASLFFSMSPLHADNHQHVLAQWIAGDKAFSFYTAHR